MKYLLGLTMLLTAAGTHAAEELDNPLDDRLRLTAGIFQSETRTYARIDNSDGSPGTLVSVEDEFGLRTTNTLADVEVQLRMRERHKLRFNYFQLNRRGNSVLERDIAFGDEIYLQTERVEAFLDLSDFSLSYGYSFLRNERFELGASLGLHLYQFEGEASVPARFVEEGDSRAAPVPAVGLFLTARLNPRLHLEGRMEYLNGQHEEFDIGFFNLHTAVFFRFTNNIAAGLGYSLFRSDVIVSEEGESGKLDFDNNGAKLLLRVSF